MPVSQLGNDRNRVQSSILSKGGRDDLERLSKGLETVRFLASQSLTVLGKQSRNVDFGSTATGDQSPLLDQTSNDTKSVVQTPLALFQDQAIGTGADDADRLAWVLDTSHLDDLGSVVLGLSFLNQVGVTQLVLGKSIDIGDRLASGRLGDELDLVPLDILDHHDLELGEEVQRELVDGVSKD